jgi:hypothetical protein
MAKAQQLAVITDTPPIFGYLKGTTKWAKVLEVDNYGKFSINMYPDANTLEKLKESFTSVLKQAEEEAVSKDKKVLMTADFIKVDEEGKEFLAFKLPELNYQDEPNKIDIYNAHGKKEEGWDKLIGNGSLVKIKYMAKPYYMASTRTVGVSLKFYAVQVIELVEYGNSDSGFGDETDDDVPFDVGSDDF